MIFLGKQNRDGSYSISVKARELVDAGWVDFYDEANGAGYQRKETMREARAKQIAEYFERCAQEDLKARLFEMTASARCRATADQVAVRFEPLDPDGQLGIVHVAPDSQPWMSMVDGGTRLRGIERAVESGTITGETYFDVRLFRELSVPEEIALFLLINENQKRVRTDLSLRVVQRRLDEGKLTDAQQKILRTVVPGTDQWRYEASRIAARLNEDPDSSFRGLIQMPSERPQGKSVALQAFSTSLKHLLSDEDLETKVKREIGPQSASNPTEFWVKVLKNFWAAVAESNPQARTEPKTVVLWGSIGVNGCHRALAEIVRSELSSEQPDLTQDRFSQMVVDSHVADYPFWYARKGSQLDEYPGEKGDATEMTGNSGYIRLSNELQRQWRANLHAAGSRKVIRL